MDICRPEDYKRLIMSYKSCFGSFYPELGLYCDNDVFILKGISRKYTDISGVSLNTDYFIVTMNKNYTIHLPMSESAKYQIVKNNRPLSS